jgi:hypothetical protein
VPEKIAITSSGHYLRGHFREEVCLRFEFYAIQISKYGENLGLKI